MKLRNSGISPLRLPTGRQVAPGDTFLDTGIPKPLLDAWRSAGSTKPVKTKKLEGDS